MCIAIGIQPHAPNKSRAFQMLFKEGTLFQLLNFNWKKLCKKKLSPGKKLSKPIPPEQRIGKRITAKRNLKQFESTLRKERK